MADEGPTGGPDAAVNPVAERGRSLRNLGLAAAGLGAVVLAMLAGRSDLLSTLLQPPAAARLLLGGAAALIGVVLLFRAASRMGEARGDARALIRSVRLVFLAVAAFAAAVGWFLGSALPIVVALVIGGVDVLETTLLLVVTAARTTEDADGATAEVANGARPDEGTHPDEGTRPEG